MDAREASLRLPTKPPESTGSVWQRSVQKINEKLWDLSVELSTKALPIYDQQIRVG